MDSRPCDNIEQFVDGELPPGEAETFRLHLPDCAECQREVAELLQLALLGERHVEGGTGNGPVIPRIFPSSRWMRPALLLGATLCMALVLAVLLPRPAPSPKEDPWLANRPRRLLEARLSHSDADRYRPLERMMGNASASAMLALGNSGPIAASDPQGVAAALLVPNDPGLANQALKQLEGLGDSPDAENDRAVAFLLQRDPEQALRHVDRALEGTPRHPQALWNRGLALRELGLTTLAARTFSEVAALQEPGWAEEAAQLADTLQRTGSERYARWSAVHKAGKALLSQSSDPLPLGFSRTPVARLFFYDAVRSAPSREWVLELLPLARDLDSLSEGHVLERYVERVASADFSRRAPFARSYAALVQGHLSSAERKNLLMALRASKEEDILLGALVQMHAVGRHLDLFEEIALKSGDPWFLLLAAQERALADKAEGRWLNARDSLLDAYRRCSEGGLEYRCIYLDRELSSISIQLHRLDDALTYARRGWTLARDRNEWTLERDLLWNLAQVSRFVNDIPLARARYDELSYRDQDGLDMVRRVHQHRADIAWNALEVDEARKELDAALATRLPLSLSGAFTLSDMARLRASPGDEAHLTRALDTARPGLSPGERAIATHVLGRFFIERDAERGRALLWQSIQEARMSQEEPAARKASAYSFTSLLFEAGRRGAFEEVLGLFEQELGMKLPSQCLLAATVDSERTLLIVRGAAGEVVGYQDETRRRPLPSRLEGFIPEALLGQLRACTKVEVLARPPLHGMAGLLPVEMAWSYWTRTAEPRPPLMGPSIHLVVHDVALPAGSRLDRLNRWPLVFGPEEKPEKLSGSEATPGAVLDAMRNAREIDLVTHGIINDSSQSSYLLLAPGPGGPELGVTRIQKASFHGAPFVILAACEAARTSYALHEPLSLPAAFIRAGARGVLAATVKIPDREAGTFFNAVRMRMRAGTSPALALRDERVQWKSEGRGGEWLDSVLLFE